MNALACDSGVWEVGTFLTQQPLLDTGRPAPVQPYVQHCRGGTAGKEAGHRLLKSQQESTPFIPI